MARSLLLLLLVGAAFASQSCRTPTPPARAPERSGVGAQAAAAGGNLGAERQTVPYPDTGWVADFGQPELTALVEESLLHNYSLQAAVARLDGATAAARAAGAALQPTLTLGADGGRGATGRASGTDSFGARLNLSWEVDLWGRLRAQQAAAGADLAATQETLAAARQSLAAQVAKAWFSARESAALTRLAAEIDASYTEQLRITRAQVRVGLAETQGLNLVETQAAQARDSRLQAENARDEALRSLELLLGRFPAAQIVLDASELTLPPAVPAGLPADILERRPDLRAAEAQVAAAFFRTAEADAARLPSLSLTAGLGAGSSALGDLLRPENVAWSLGAGLLGPIFDGGRREAVLQQADAAQRAALAEYGQKALAAFREVESALARETFLAARRAAAHEAVLSSGEALRISRARYAAGTEDMLDLLQIQRQHDSARITWLSLYYDQLLNRVDLHLALGGSFEPR